MDNSDLNFDITQIHQPGIDQVPYDELYLDITGHEKISEFPATPESRILRVIFFLHYFNPDLPLLTQYGEIKCSELKEIPERIDKIYKYVPVD